MSLAVGIAAVPTGCFSHSNFVHFVEDVGTLFDCTPDSWY